MLCYVILCCVFLYVYGRAIPEGGLHGLRDKHRLGWEYFDALITLAQAGVTLTIKQLAYGQRYVVASLWVYADNARPMAIEKLTLKGSVLCCVMLCYDALLCYGAMLLRYAAVLLCYCAMLY